MSELKRKFWKRVCKAGAHGRDDKVLGAEVEEARVAAAMRCDEERAAEQAKLAELNVHHRMHVAAAGAHGRDDKVLGAEVKEARVAAAMRCDEERAAEQAKLAELNVQYRMHVAATLGRMGGATSIGCMWLRLGAHGAERQGAERGGGGGEGCGNDAVDEERAAEQAKLARSEHTV
ncbi:hypothetical protein CYMTET_51283 [Cymbomonas tetramitiformis]|uniref:Uncharacterized protein n=1 Tax=Cymbomonas tetramitiformis TaxID=36881 RepID=A0AAE0ETW5_9CHLO|nr:hypothetical protein CYMTET_51283 [Cymbomonas tetramitiformis]